MHPTNELVAVAWMKEVTGLSTVATDVPEDNSSWSASGFVQVQALAGVPENYVGVRQPVFTVDCWGVSPGRPRPPWARANQLAERIRAAVLDHGGVPLDVTTLPAAYTPARVLSAVMLTEPRRVVSDDADYAHYQLDLQLWWVEGA